MYRNANINDLIGRFEVPKNDSFDASENVKSLRTQTSRNRGVNETFDQNRSIMKFSAGHENFFDRTILMRRSTVSMSSVKEFIKQVLLRISALLEMISKFPFPRMSVMSFGLTSLLAIFLAPRAFTERALYPGFRLIFTTIYPAYRSFKAVRNKNLKEYLKWIVFWIVYAFFTCFELVTDALFNWFPFYYEIKVIILIWLLGPSSRGSMKVYKNCIHPMLISREQEIDDIIQLAQEHGYMHVFRLSSKSVNYANKIIMQDSNSDTNFIVSHQLMRNISLSNVSDAGTTMSNEDNEEILRMRRFSAGKIPIYGNQLNYSYENLETPRRKPSYDSKYEDVSFTSSGYASPTAELYRSPLTAQQQRAFIEEYDENPPYSNLSRTFSAPETIPSQIIAPRRASLNELSEDEIIFAYNRLLHQQQPKQQQEPKPRIEEEKVDELKPKRMIDDENYKEFLKWMEMKRKNEIVEKEKNLPASFLNEEKVIPSNPSNGDDDKVVTEKEKEENVVDEIHQDFDDFKDAISDESSDEVLKVPLKIIEENDEIPLIPTTIVEENISHEHSPPISTFRNSSENSKNNVINAKLMLSNDALQIVTDLSASNVSLASSTKSTDDLENRKRPATHKKGRAPLPPTSSDVNDVEGFYYDKLTKKLFKETEL